MTTIIIVSIVVIAFLIVFGFFAYAFFRLTNDWNDEIIAKEEALKQISEDLKAIKKKIA